MKNSSPLWMSRAVLLLVLAWFCPLQGQIHFTSVEMIERLLRHEALEINYTRSAVTEMKKTLAYLKEAIQELKQGHTEAREQMHRGNPVLIFNTVKRMALDVRLLLIDMREFQQKLAELTIPRRYPSYDDLFGIVKAIHSTCDTYDIPLGDVLLSGKIGSHETKAGLSSDELLIFYLTTLYEESDPLSVDHQSKVVNELTNFNDTLFETILENIASNDMKSSNRVLYDEAVIVNNFIMLTQYFVSNSGYEKGNYFEDKIRERHPGIFENRPVIRKRDNGFMKKHGVPHKITNKSPEAAYTYKQACQGNLPISEKIKSQLKCYYESYKNPFLKIGPFKVEVLYADPKVIKIYDAITDYEIEKVIENSKRRIRRGQVVSEEGKAVYSESRLSNSYFFDSCSYETNPFLINLDQRMVDMTNLVIGCNEKAEENMQSSNYGPGGFYDVHFDSRERDDPVGTWRMATLMFYLTDVEMGGATIFPAINLTVFPEKGSAILWYNAHANTLKDHRMYHAGCPVALGNKWVVNQWITETNQLFVRPCIYGEEFTDMDSYSYRNWNITPREYFTPEFLEIYAID